MSTWTKIFVDGTKEIGTEIDILEGRASWSKGKLEHIAACKLYSFMCTATLVIPNTSWHQFDRLIAPLGFYENVPSVLTHKVIQAQILKEHVGKFIRIRTFGSFDEQREYYLLDELDTGSQVFVELEEEHVGKWFTMMLTKQGHSYGIFNKGKIDNG